MHMFIIPHIDPPDYCHLAGGWLIAANCLVGYYYDLREQPKLQLSLFFHSHLIAVFFSFLCCVTATNVHSDSLTFLVTKIQFGKVVRRVNINKVSASIMGPFVEPLMHYDLPQNYPGIADVVIRSHLMILKPKTNYTHIQLTVYDLKDLRPCLQTSANSC
ncbi:hypothetical protein BKA82DRAFT_2252431 [Pisolithus tinctorius]|nr:hypothetical protein BKA82DRAFT_2252431 [Pisolithus tinctorius]